MWAAGTALPRLKHMHIRIVSILLAAVAALVVGPAAAQQQRGATARLTDMQGSVLVSQGDAMVPAVNGQRIASGTRVVTAKGGRVVVRYDGGCDVILKESQRFIVHDGECACLAGEDDAQANRDPVARLSDLEGNVLVSRDDAMIAAATDQRVASGTRVLTTAGAGVVVNFDNGCDVRLKENERFTVRVADCRCLVGEVAQVGPAPGEAVAGAGTAETTLRLIGVGVFGVGAYEFFKKPSVSPN
jgi:hypothetical protein